MGRLWTRPEAVMGDDILGHMAGARRLDIRARRGFRAALLARATGLDTRSGSDAATACGNYLALLCRLPLVDLWPTGARRPGERDRQELGQKSCLRWNVPMAVPRAASDHAN